MGGHRSKGSVAEHFKGDTSSMKVEVLEQHPAYHKLLVRQLTLIVTLSGGTRPQLHTDQNGTHYSISYDLHFFIISDAKLTFVSVILYITFLSLQVNFPLLVSLVVVSLVDDTTLTDWQHLHLPSPHFTVTVAGLSLLDFNAPDGLPDAFPLCTDAFCFSSLPIVATGGIWFCCFVLSSIE